jgi:hypothetical protein
MKNKPKVEEASTGEPPRARSWLPHCIDMLTSLLMRKKNGSQSLEGKHTTGKKIIEICYSIMVWFDVACNPTTYI